MNDEESTRGHDRSRRENPAARIIGPVRQAHAGQIHAGAGWIAQFHPVGNRPVRVGDRLVVREHLVDDDTGGGRRIREDDRVEPHAEYHIGAADALLVNFNRDHVVARDKTGQA